MLERDDAVKFAMPIQAVPLLDKFPEAPSQNVWIAVRHFDDSETVVLRGISIQNVIGDLIAVWSDQVQTLNVTVNIGLRASSAVPPGNPNLMGKTNQNAISFIEGESDAQYPEQQNAENAVAFTFPAYAIVSNDNSRAVMLPHPDGLMLPIFISKENIDGLTSRVGEDTAVVSFQRATELLDFVENPPHSSVNELPSFDVLLDSVGPEGQQFGMIRKQNFIAFLKNMGE